MTEAGALASTPLVEAAGLRKHFPIKRGIFGRTQGHVQAVEDVSFTLRAGEVLGLVGESGSGKSTVGRLLLRLQEPTGGQVRFSGADITALPPAALRPLRRRMQMIFQDPFSSLNPRMTISAAIGEALRVHNIGKRGELSDRTAAILERVGLGADVLHRYPRAFSGGQRQRVAIARALAVQPEFIVADEPSSALDVSIQAEVINLLQELQRELNLALLFISHDLAVVEVIADRVMVLYLGRVMEIGPTERIYTNAQHPYTRALLSASPSHPVADRKQRIVLKGEIPNPANPPSGCVFRTRCPFVIEACAREVPAVRDVAPGHSKACIRDDLFDA
jgi:oligopeptide/dipeptide ABC transporter ATP-binding protein